MSGISTRLRVVVVVVVGVYHALKSLWRNMLQSVTSTPGKGLPERDCWLLVIEGYLVGLESRFLKLRHDKQCNPYIIPDPFQFYHGQELMPAIDLEVLGWESVLSPFGTRVYSFNPFSPFPT